MVTINGGDETIYPEPGVTKVLSESVANEHLLVRLEPGSVAAPVGYIILSSQPLLRRARHPGANQWDTVLAC